MENESMEKKNSKLRIQTKQLSHLKSVIGKTEMKNISEKHNDSFQLTPPRELKLHEK